MKRILSIISIATIMAVFCKSKTQPQTPAATVPATDTAGLAQYQQWKAQNELSTLNSTQNNGAATSSTASTSHNTGSSTTRHSTSNNKVYSSSSSSSNTAQAPAK